MAWSVLDAANDLGEYITVDACRRVIDANLRGDVPGGVGHVGDCCVLQ